MGCTNGKPCGDPSGSGGSCSPQLEDSKKDKHDKQRLLGTLLDKYSLGKVLGQGAFGVVYLCRKKNTKEEYAVKMIDQVETPLAEIKQEVDMLKRLSHPCVVKLHDVYYEKVFVCLVMDIHKGGDMIEGMQMHWKGKGMIPISVCQNICKMMFQGVEWLHQNNVVHRDLKGDNYLQSRKDIEHPSCRVYLTDFGTVVDLPPGTRLKSRCGTKTYWAPEFFALNYGLKVDIWAVGVILYGMVTGRFPFKGEEDVKNKQIKIPTRCDKNGEDFVMKTLDRDEDRRLSAKQALDHPWLSSIKSAAEAECEKLEPGFKADVKESGANAGVKERRRELVERLELAAAKPTAFIVNPEALTKNFEVFHEHQETTVKFEWWSPSQVAGAKFVDESKAVQVNDEDLTTNVQSSEEQIRTMLEGMGVKTANFGKGQAKKFTEFVHEVQSGQSRLMLDATKHKNIVRAVDVVLLRIVHGTGANKRYLVTAAERYPDGRMRNDINQLAGTKKLPHENGIQTAMRIVKERVIDADGKIIKFDFQHQESFEEDDESPSYPGVRTVYRKEIFEGQIVSNDPAVLEKLGLAGRGSGQFSQQDAKGYTRFFDWMTEAQCEAKKVVLKSMKDRADFSALVHPPIGFEEDELQAFLQANNVDVSRFGRDGVKSLRDFSEELVKGEATLTRQEGGRIIRVVDVVILKLTKGSGDTLVEVQETSDAGVVKPTKRLPAVKRRYDENPYWAAHRVLNKVLKVSENLVIFDPTKVQLVEEETASKAYADLPTIYRRRIIPARLVAEV